MGSATFTPEISLRKPIIRAAIGTALILAIPLGMMQISSEWNWGVFDFVFMGALIFSAAMTYELVARHAMAKVGAGLAYRAATAIAVFTSLILIWVNAAVGIIGDGPHNMLYGGVIAVGVIGAMLARLRPRGMANTLFAMALTQMLVPVVVLLIWDPPFSPCVVPVFALNAVFAGLFAVAGILFRRAQDLS